MQQLTVELNGMRTRGWNSETPLVFMVFIITITYNLRSLKDIRACIDQKMDLWYQVRFVSLVENTANALQGEEEDPIRASLRQHERSVQ